MSAISVMEMNAKCPLVWDWESLVMFPPRAVVEVPKKLQVVDSEFEAVDCFEAVSLHSSGGRSDGGISGGSASDLAYGSSSKSSKSASVDSSSNREMRESKFRLETSDCFSQDLSCGKELASVWPATTSRKASPAADFSIGSIESLVGLKLGKRTYFEDVSAGSNTKSSALVSVSGPSSDTITKSSKLSSIEVPRCQVEGCSLDLSFAKEYHRKHRVCEDHSKSPKVIICGLERRFCQQCSRFHSLSEFDQKKRSCRRRLSDHNARRRKPRPEVIQFSSMGLPSSLHEGRNQISLAFNQVPVVHPRPNANSIWDFTSNTKFTPQEKLSLFPPVKAAGVDELHAPEDSSFKLSFDSSQFLPSSNSKVPSAQVFHQGLQVPSTSNTDMEAAQDDLRALSLLSTNSWSGVSSCDPRQQQHQRQQHSHLHHHSNNNTSNTLHGLTSPSSHLPLTIAPLHVALASLPPPAQPVSAHYRLGNQPLLLPAASSGLYKNGGNSHFQEFQLFKSPNEAGFYSC